MEGNDTKRFAYIRRVISDVIVSSRDTQKLFPFHSWKRKKFPAVGIADVTGTISNDLTTRPMVEVSLLESRVTLSHPGPVHEVMTAYLQLRIFLDCGPSLRLPKKNVR